MKTVKLFLFSLLLSFTVQPLVAQDSIVIAQPIIFSPPITVPGLTIIDPGLITPGIIFEPVQPQPNPDFNLFFPYLSINRTGIKNPEELPHFGSTEPVIFEGNSIKINGNVEIGDNREVKIALIFDWNGDGIFQENEIKEIIVSKNGNFEFNIELTDKEIAAFESGAIPVHIRAFVDSLYESTNTASVTFLLMTIDKPIGDVSTAEIDQYIGITCIQPKDDFIRFTLSNTHNYDVNVSAIIVDGINVIETGSLLEDPGSTIVNNTFTIEKNTDKAFTLYMTLPKEEICFKIPIEVEYFYGNGGFIPNSGNMEELVQLITYSNSDILNYCYCDGFNSQQNESLRSAIFDSTIPTSTITAPVNSTTALEVYPTLVQHSFTLNYTLNEPTKVAIILSTINGSKSHIRLNNPFQDKGKHTFELDISHLPPGIYLVTLSIGDALLHQKIIKQ